MAATLSIPTPSRLEVVVPQTRKREFVRREHVLIAAGLALVCKLLIAWNTIGTNDVAFFFHLGESLTKRGLEASYASDIAFNHPPLIALFTRTIYIWNFLPWFRENGIEFPFLLRLPGILADFVVIIALLGVAKELRLPMWSLLVLALSPVSLMISGYHGNTDSIMVMFLVLAAIMALRDRPMLCGVFLALSCQIKIIPALLLPIFFFYWLHRRRGSHFSLPFAATMAICWLEPLLNFPALFLHRVLLYVSFWGLWGITYWLRLTGLHEFAPVTYHHLLPGQQVVVTILKVALVAAVVLLAWRRRKLDARGLFISLGLAWVIFFVFSPGVCTQYMVWLMPFVLVLSPFCFACLTATSSLFVFFFYNSISGGLPWYYGVSTGRLNIEWTPWTIWPWATLIVGGLLLWRRGLRNDPTLRLLALSSVEYESEL